MRKIVHKFLQVMKINKILYAGMTNENSRDGFFSPLQEPPEFTPIPTAISPIA